MSDHLYSDDTDRRESGPPEAWMMGWTDYFFKGAVENPYPAGTAQAVQWEDGKRQAEAEFAKSRGWTARS